MITQERLKELLHYDPDTGVFTWAVSQGRVRVGAVAGTRRKDGYWKVGLDRGLYLTHRLAFLYVTGKFPEQLVDHVNGDRADNRWCNLREATSAENQQNQRATQRKTSSGLLGVSWVKQAGKWLATITANKQRRFLGYFSTAEEAHAAYLTAKKELHPFSTI